MLAITQPVDASLLHSVCALVGGDRGGAAAGWKTPPMGNEFAIETLACQYGTCIQNTAGFI
jgi:hypothetical protein